MSLWKIGGGQCGRQTFFFPPAQLVGEMEQKSDESGMGTDFKNNLMLYKPIPTFLVFHSLELKAFVSMVIDCSAMKEGCRVRTTAFGQPLESVIGV